jgi:hypothetical protein
LTVPSEVDRSVAISCVDMPLMAKSATSRSAGVRPQSTKRSSSNLHEGGRGAAKRLLGPAGSAEALAQHERPEDDAEDKPQRRPELDQLDEGPVERLVGDAENACKDLAHEEEGAEHLHHKDDADDGLVRHASRAEVVGEPVIRPQSSSSLSSEPPEPLPELSLLPPSSSSSLSPEPLPELLEPLPELSSSSSERSLPESTIRGPNFPTCPGFRHRRSLGRPMRFAGPRPAAPVPRCPEIAQDHAG